MATPVASTPAAPGSALPIPQHLNISGTPKSVTSDKAGYVPSPFPAKGQQQEAVADILVQSGFMPRELVHGEVDWFYNSLGIDNGYFLAENPQIIADHVLGGLGQTMVSNTTLSRPVSRAPGRRGLGRPSDATPKAGIRYELTRRSVPWGMGGLPGLVGEEPGEGL
ncbi:glutamate dehydrogenase [Trichosporon asahii var. asahii CBS 8904]|uniref:Glutamate dehydrogenase n=1 Tax=Trichosporon asahii var. asahii (strain CBS 8904) TaxID=1220162 RepID=K1VYP7_TRIAC|nr:glutamate dehydrogenase [Trichosporon asahii var. asahii CBS 8904]